jgi:hypothetical protein
MKRETAEKIAAAESGVELDKAMAVIKAFRDALVKCPVCDGTGQFTYRAEVKVPVGDFGGGRKMTDVAIGESGSCPLCGPVGKGDPEWVLWHCRDGYNKCHSGNQELAKGHEDCGWIVALPL